MAAGMDARARAKDAPMNGAPQHGATIHTSRRRGLAPFQLGNGASATAKGCIAHGKTNPPKVPKSAKTIKAINVRLRRESRASGSTIVDDANLRQQASVSVASAVVWTDLRADSLQVLGTFSRFPPTISVENKACLCVVPLVSFSPI
jgi:hypothetical protein